MIFKTRNEVTSVLIFFVIIINIKVSGLSKKLELVLVSLPIILSLLLSKFRNNRTNIDITSNRTSKSCKNFLSDSFVNSKIVEYGSTIIWVISVLIIVRELIKVL
ncbi:MAG: hypothetical protein ACRDA4_07680 [Filifactoraceae bacterium]